MKTDLDVFLNGLTDLTDNEISTLKTLFLPIVLLKNDFFIKEGQLCNILGFVNSGMLRHYYNTSNGEEITRWITLEGNFITSLAGFLSQKPSLEIIQAIEKCELFVIKKTDFQKYYEKSSILRNMWTKNIEYHYLGMEERVFSLIALNADQRYELFCNQYPDFIKNVPLKYIASMLGIEPRHLSRIRRKILKAIYPKLLVCFNCVI